MRIRIVQKISADTLQQFFAQTLGADLGALGPGEIRVARCAAREDAESGPDGIERASPVWIAVGGGRAVVSTSRLLYRTVEAWAENFAAPDLLLRADFLEDLRRQVAQVMAGAVRIQRARLFASVDAARNPDATPARQCLESDRDAAQRLIAAGFREKARIVRFSVER